MSRGLVTRANTWRGAKADLDLQHMEDKDVAIDNDGKLYQAMGRGLGSAVLQEISQDLDRDEVLQFPLNPDTTDVPSVVKEDDVELLQMPDGMTKAAIGTFRLPGQKMSFDAADLCGLFIPGLVVRSVGTSDNLSVGLTFRARSIAFSQKTDKTALAGVTNTSQVITATLNEAKKWTGSVGPANLNPNDFGSAGSNAIVSVYIARTGGTDTFDGEVGMPRYGIFTYKRKKSA